MIGEWRPVVGYEEYYEVSDFGKVYSKITKKVLKDRIDKKGYNNVRLKGRYFKMSHIVALAFPEICGEWFEGAEVDHINGVRNDNRPENLRVCDHLTNVRNPLTIERFKSRRRPKPRCFSIVINGMEFSSQREAAKYFGVSETYIYDVKKGKIKRPLKLRG